MMRVFCLLVSLFFSVAVIAEEKRLQLSEFEQSLSAHGRMKANDWEYWGLDKAEWDRYLQLMKNSPWALWKHEATPLAILSHYSESQVEKHRYARLQAEIDQWRENTVFEWQQIYNREREIIHAKNAAIYNSRKPDITKVKARDRILYFVDSGECETRCVGMTNRLLESGAHLDIFVIGAKDEKEIFAWATDADIPVDRVKVKQITLNFENNYLDTITTTPRSMVSIPAAFLEMDDGYKRVIFK